MWYTYFFRCYVNKQIAVSELTWYIKPTKLKQAFQQVPYTTQHSSAAGLPANQDAHRDIIPSDHLPTKWSFPFSLLRLISLQCKIRIFEMNISRDVKMKTIYFSGICSAATVYVQDSMVRGRCEQKSQLSSLSSVAAMLCEIVHFTSGWSFM